MDRKRFIGSACAVLAAATLLAAAVHRAAAEEAWARLPPRTERPAVEGVEAEITVEPEFCIVVGTPASRLDLRARASLGDFQAKLLDMLRALAARKSRCETRWSLPRLDPAAVTNGRLRLSGEISVEQWLCAGPLKTRLASETAGFTLAVYPAWSAEAIRVNAELERFDLGGGLLGALGLDRELAGALRRELDKALGGPAAGLGFPPETEAFGPRFTGARLEGGGQEAVLAAEAEARIEPADLPALGRLLAAHR